MQSVGASTFSDFFVLSVGTDLAVPSVSTYCAVRSVGTTTVSVCSVRSIDILRVPCVPLVISIPFRAFHRYYLISVHAVGTTSAVLAVRTADTHFSVHSAVTYNCSLNMFRAFRRYVFLLCVLSVLPSFHVFVYFPSVHNLLCVPSIQVRTGCVVFAVRFVATYFGVCFAGKKQSGHVQQSGQISAATASYYFFLRT